VRQGKPHIVLSDDTWIPYADGLVPLMRLSDLRRADGPHTSLILHRFGQLEICDRPGNKLKHHKGKGGTILSTTLCLPDNSRSEAATKPIACPADDNGCSATPIVFAMSVSPGSGITSIDQELLSSLRASQEKSSTGKLNGTLLLQANSWHCARIIL